jgi:hypothetical protein
VALGEEARNPPRPFRRQHLSGRIAQAGTSARSRALVPVRLMFLPVSPGPSARRAVHSGRGHSCSSPRCRGRSGTRADGGMYSASPARHVGRTCPPGRGHRGDHRDEDGRRPGRGPGPRSGTAVRPGRPAPAHRPAPLGGEGDLPAGRAWRLALRLPGAGPAQRTGPDPRQGERGGEGGGGGIDCRRSDLTSSTSPVDRACPPVPGPTFRSGREGSAACSPGR